MIPSTNLLLPILIALCLLLADGDTPARAQSQLDTILPSTTLTATDGAPNDQLGAALAVSGDWLAVGAPHVTPVVEGLPEDDRSRGSVVIFNQAGGDQWRQVARLVAADGALGDHFGAAVAIVSNTLVVAAPDADVNGRVDQGAIYLFVRNPAIPNQWEQVQKLVPEDGMMGDGATGERFGRNLAFDGTTIVAGAAEKVYLFTKKGATADSWSQVKRLNLPDPAPVPGFDITGFGNNVAIQGDVVLIGAGNGTVGQNQGQGAAYLFGRDQGGANQWGLLKKLVAADGRTSDGFGAEVALWNEQAFVSAVGKRAILAGIDGAVYLFGRNQTGANQWGEAQQLSSDRAIDAHSLGRPLGVYGNHLVAGTTQFLYLYRSNPNETDKWQLFKRAVLPESGWDVRYALASHDRWFFLGAPATPLQESAQGSAQGAVYLYDYNAPAAPIVSLPQLAYTVDEHGGTVVITATLDRPNPFVTLTVDYQAASLFAQEAVAEIDYGAIRGTLSFTQGGNEARVAIPIHDDGYPERDEPFQVTLSNVQGGLFGGYWPPSAQVKIIDNDAGVACDFAAQDEASFNLALNCANVAGSGRHTISLTADISLTHPSTLLLNLAASQIVIEGNGHRLDAQGHGRVLTLDRTHLLVRNLTLTGGRLPLDRFSQSYGGAIHLLASYESDDCSLTLEQTVLYDNEAYAGGALSNLCDGSEITITQSIFRDNHAVQGGAIYIATGEEIVSEWLLSRSIISHNRAERIGGGLYLSGGHRVTINDTTISHNSVNSGFGDEIGDEAREGVGGGIAMRTHEEGGVEMLLNRSLLAYNTAQKGGGLHINAIGFTHVTLANLTISSNRAVSEAGGLMLQGNAENVNLEYSDLRLINSTITSNTAASGGGIYKIDGLLTLTNTLIAGNPAGGDCLLTASPDLPNRYHSGGHNLDGDGSCLPSDVRQSSDIVKGDAKLVPLADHSMDHSGASMSHALLPDSQAIDAGADATCASAPVDAVDGRGVTRPQGDHCDIGAFESETPRAEQPMQRSFLPLILSP